MKIVLGGKSLFKENDYELLLSGKQMIKNDIAPELKGYENKIEIRGHTASAAYGPGSQWADSWELAYRRSKSVMQFLVDDCGIEQTRCRVVSCGDTEPIATNLTAEGRSKNRRVEVVMTEEFISERAERRQMMQGE